MSTCKQQINSAAFESSSKAGENRASGLQTPSSPEVIEEETGCAPGRRGTPSASPGPRLKGVSVGHWGSEEFPRGPALVRAWQSRGKTQVATARLTAQEEGKGGKVLSAVFSSLSLQGFANFKVVSGKTGRSVWSQRVSCSQSGHRAVLSVALGRTGQVRSIGHQAMPGRVGKGGKVQDQGQEIDVKLMAPSCRRGLVTWDREVEADSQDWARAPGLLAT